ncbi:MAG: hypothetical protein ACRCY5_07050 [Phocaeicola sp.]
MEELNKQAQEAFKQFIEAKYTPYGPNSKMIFRSTRELVYDCREMCTPSLYDVNEVMTELKFKSDQFCGQYTWVLYEVEELRY